MKKAAQLDWTDLQEIAKMKGVQCLVAPPVPAAATAESPASESEHETGTVGVVSSGAQGSVGSDGSAQTSLHDRGRSGSPEKEPEDP